MQEWDYFLGIATIKRQQALYQGTLVAQGAFSVYDAGALRRAGGWQDRSVEDIVLTWALLSAGGRTLYEATAVAFTRTPTRIGHFTRQRRRWARGMIEGLREYGRGLVRQPAWLRRLRLRLPAPLLAGLALGLRQRAHPPPGAVAGGVDDILGAG